MLLVANMMTDVAHKNGHLGVETAWRQPSCVGRGEVCTVQAPAPTLARRAQSPVTPSSRTGRIEPGKANRVHLLAGAAQGGGVLLKPPASSRQATPPWRSQSPAETSRLGPP
jgi:hypothetical protein